MRLLRGFLVLLFAWAAPVTAQDLPAYSSVLVNDFADVLSPETEDSLNAMLQTARDLRDHEMTVVTIDSVNSYTPGLSIERFAKVLFNTWGVGNAERNDGLMLVVAVEDREMRIALGSGYRARFDGIAKRIIDSEMVPEFKAGRMEQGILRGVEESLARLRLDAVEPEPAGLEERFERFREDHPGWGIAVIIIGVLSFPLVVILGPFVLFGGVRGLIRRRPRKCPECGRLMLRLGDKQEDQYLDAGQIFEEELSSKDYGVWFCEHDEHLTIVGYPKMFSRHKACPNCRYHTYETHSTTLQAATTEAGGRKRLDSTCKNCGHHDTREVSTSRLVRTSSSSSSSGGGGSSGGFGGGSSSGGGASGSW